MTLPKGVKILPGGLILYRLTRSDKWFLSVYLGLLLWPLLWSVVASGIYYIGYYEDLRPSGNWHLYYWAVGCLVAVLTVLLGMSTRFRNLYYSLVWLALTLGLGEGVQHWSGAIMPLGMFVYCHLARLRYWHKHQMEFVPWQFVKYQGFVRIYYALEDRWSRQEELGYSKLYFGVSWLVLFGCFVVAMLAFRLTL